MQHLFDPAVEAFDHPVGLRVLRRCKAVFDFKVCAELVELVLPGGLAFAQTEQAVGEFLPVIGQDRPDPDWAGPFQIAQKAAGISGGLGFEDPDEDPAGCPVNCHEQVAARGFVSHLRQILHIDMQVAGRVGLERLVLWSGVFRQQVAQITHLMPPQTPVQPRARNLRVQELPEHRQEIVERHQQCFAQNHRHCLLRRGQRGLQPVRRVAAILHTIAMLPFVDGLLSRPEDRPAKTDAGSALAWIAARTFGVVVAWM